MTDPGGAVNTKLIKISDTGARRNAIIQGFRQVLLAHQEKAPGSLTDVAVYGKRFTPPKLIQVDYNAGSDSFGFSVHVCGAPLDVILVLRYGDPRIGVFIPNIVFSDAEEDLLDTMMILMGNASDRAKQNKPALALAVALDSGFGAYPAVGRDGCPHVTARRFDTGAYVEYSFYGDIRCALNAALSGENTPDITADALGHACVHIIQAIASHVHSSQVKSRTMRGMMSRYEFASRLTSSELIRTYQLEPHQLEVLSEAHSEGSGQYIISADASDEELVQIMLAEIRQASSFSSQ